MITVELLNDDKFMSKLKQYQQVSKKNMADVINSKLGDVAVTAIGTTYRTNAAQIASELQRVQGKVVTRKVLSHLALQSLARLRSVRSGSMRLDLRRNQ
jgi:hypothetical protein